MMMNQPQRSEQAAEKLIVQLEDFRKSINDYFDSMISEYSKTKSLGQLEERLIEFETLISIINRNIN